mmetsp:Transcript_2908/g.8035  ORF Transcript_2908/g.8035 Transcript_2908/m.8035 type:complete len:225 (-) Transcript_2908:120-794(-)
MEKLAYLVGVNALLAEVGTNLGVLHAPPKLLLRNLTALRVVDLVEDLPQRGEVIPLFHDFALHCQTTVSLAPYLCALDHHGCENVQQQNEGEADIQQEQAPIAPAENAQVLPEHLPVDATRDHLEECQHGVKQRAESLPQRRQLLVQCPPRCRPAPHQEGERSLGQHGAEDEQDHEDQRAGPHHGLDRPCERKDHDAQLPEGTMLADHVGHHHERQDSGQAQCG